MRNVSAIAAEVTPIREYDNRPIGEGKRGPITIDDVLMSKMVADPLHLLEIVMPCAGGAGVEDVGDSIRLPGADRRKRRADRGEEDQRDDRGLRGCGEQQRLPLRPVADAVTALQRGFERY